MRHRRRRRNSWHGHKAGHRAAALKGWRKRKHSRKYSRKHSRKYGKRSGKKFVRVGGRKLSWKGLVKRFGVKKAKKLYRKGKRGRASNRRRFRRSRR
jgi:hypothetical protein